MTDEERSEEGAEEAIEDLDAPAEAQDDVAGGAACRKPSGPGGCRPPTCLDSGPVCPKPSEVVVRD